MTLAVIKAIREQGLNVPRDISIIGFDDIAMAKYVTPALTTIRQDKELIGNVVADVLYQCIVEGDSKKVIPRIPVTVVERESVIDIN